MSMGWLPVTQREDGGLASGVPPLWSVWRLEVERHPCGRGSDGRAADRVIGRIATADLVAVTARAETVMRTRTLTELGGDDVPAGPVVEVIAGADRILGSIIREQVALQGWCACEGRIIDTQHGGIARTLEGMGVGPADGPFADHLGCTGEHGVAGSFVEWLFGRGHVSPYPLIVGVELKIAETVIKAITAADLRGPFVVNARHD